MSARVFFDTNVILYSYSIKYEPKKEIARERILHSAGVISTQVMQEMCNVLTRKLKQDEVSITKVLAELNKNFFVFINNIETVNKALDIHFKYRFSY